MRKRVASYIRPAGLIVLAGPFVERLFERGAFDHAATVMTAQALACYAVGLYAYSAAKVLTGAFYALRDTWTPVRLAAQTVVANILLSVALMWPLQVGGLALAASITNSVNAMRLARGMERRLGTPLIAPSIGPLLRMAAASVVMGLGCWLLWRAGLARTPAWLGLPSVIAAGVALYLVSCRLLRVQELETALRWLGTLRPQR